MGSQGNKVGHILWPHQRREVFYPRELGPGCIELNLFNTEKALHCPKTLAGFLESQKPLRIWVWTPMRSGIPAEQSLSRGSTQRQAFLSFSHWPSPPPLLAFCLPTIHTNLGWTRLHDKMLPWASRWTRELQQSDDLWFAEAALTFRIVPNMWEELGKYFLDE